MIVFCAEFKTEHCSTFDDELLHSLVLLGGVFIKNPPPPPPRKKKNTQGPRRKRTESASAAPVIANYLVGLGSFVIDWLSRDDAQRIYPENPP